MLTVHLHPLSSIVIEHLDRFVADEPRLMAADPSEARPYHVISPPSRPEDQDAPVPA